MERDGEKQTNGRGGKDYKRRGMKGGDKWTGGVRKRQEG